MTQEAKDSGVITWSQAITAVPGAMHGQDLGPGTLRMSLAVGGGGARVRIHLSNRYGSKPVTVTAARVAAELPDRGDPSKETPLQFGSRASVVLSAGQEIASDHLDMYLPRNSRLRLSLDLAEGIPLTSVNSVATDEWLYFPPGTESASSPIGGQRLEFDLGGTLQPMPLPLLAALEIRGQGDKLCIIGFGDSITAGGWPAHLSELMRGADVPGSWGVGNRGISGNRLLRDGAGPFGAWFGTAGLQRFGYDVLDTPGVTHVFVLEGINDLLHPGTAAPAEEEVSASDLIEGYRSLVGMAHARNIKVLLCTLLPFSGAEGFTPEREKVRQEVNHWMSTADEADGYVPTDATLADPRDPTRLLAEFDSGDHLHPNDRGQKAIAASIHAAAQRAGIY